MTKSVRYQTGQLYRQHGAWFVRYRERVREENGSIKLQRRTKRLGSVGEFPTKSDIEPLRTAFMHRANAGQFGPESNMTLCDFVETVYLPWVEADRRASTYKGYREIWENHILKRLGETRLREFRTVHASKMLRAIAAECDLTKTTIQHIKSVLSGIFTYAKNEGAYDGVNPVQGAMLPSGTRDPEETYAYNLVQILQILDFLPLLPRAVVGTASFAGLRVGELRGLEWPDYTGEALAVNRSIWKGVVNKPKTRASCQPVPVIPKLAKILDEYRASMHNPKTGVVFHNGSGACLDMDKMAARVIRPAIEVAGLPWYGWHGFRRGIASNLYELGANDKIVQRILRHAKPHVTKERYIKAFDPAVLEAMQRMQATLDVLEQESSSSPADKLRACGKLLKTRRGEVAERLKAAVC